MEFANATFEKNDDGTFNVIGVEVFAEGKHTAMDGKKVNATKKMLKDMVATAVEAKDEMKAPVRLGHVHQLKDGTEAPRVGTVRNHRYKEGKISKILVDLVSVPKKVVTLMKNGAYPARSVGFLKSWTSSSGKVFKNILDHVALLGSSRPAVSTLADVAKMYAAVDLDEDHLCFESPTFDTEEGVVKFGLLGDQVAEEEDREKLNRLTWAAQRIVGDIVRGEGDFEDFDTDEKKEAIAEVLDELEAETSKMMASADDDGEPVTPDSGADDQGADAPDDSEPSLSDDAGTEPKDDDMSGKTDAPDTSTLTAERDEAQTQLAAEKEKREAAEKKTAEAEQKQRTADAEKEAAEFFSALEGKILPAEREIVEPMMVASLAAAADDKSMIFSAKIGEAVQEMSVADGLKALFATREKISTKMFELTFAAPDIEKGEADPAAQIIKLSHERAAKDSIEFKAAYELIRGENPELVEQIEESREES